VRVLQRANANHLARARASALLERGLAMSSACALLRPLGPVLDRWPLLRSTPGLAQLRWAQSDHLATIEPLSVAAFANAIANGPNESVVLDIGANVGAYTLLAGALGRRVVAVEMQPGCREWQRCHSAQLGLDPTGWVRFLNRFVATSERVAPVRVPKTGCKTMASPSAVVGRWPHGLRTKETLAPAARARGGAAAGGVDVCQRERRARTRDARGAHDGAVDACAHAAARQVGHRGECQDRL